MDLCLGCSGAPDIVDDGLSSDKGDLRSLTAVECLHVCEGGEGGSLQLLYGGLMLTNFIKNLSEHKRKLNVQPVLGYWACSVMGYRACSVLGYRACSVLGYRACSVPGPGYRACFAPTYHFWRRASVSSIGNQI
jgi:hypothetical protein